MISIMFQIYYSTTTELFEIHEANLSLHLFLPMFIFMVAGRNLSIFISRESSYTAEIYMQAFI